VSSGPEPHALLAAERASAASRIAALERDLAAIIDAASQANGDDEHDPEGATIAFERQHTAALLDQARDQISHIDAALRRVRDGSYGRCERCGQSIAAGRLAARPVTTTCITCASSRRPR
jgi:RNA polymerase-binding protein DksA